MIKVRRTTRRSLIGGLASAMGLTVLGASCVGNQASPRPTPAPESASTEEPGVDIALSIRTPTPTATPRVTSTPTPARSIARARTLTVYWGGVDGRYPDRITWNPYALDTIQQIGLNLMYEPLFYYSVFENRWIPWLATGYEYSSDHGQLTIRLRDGVQWSDGTTFTSEDVAYTFLVLRDLGPKVRGGFDVQRFVAGVDAPDARTVVLRFRAPAPHFANQLAYRLDTGLTIVPKHVFSGNTDWSTFSAFDPDQGWPVTTGPWRLTVADTQQRALERRDDWWAVNAGLARMPIVERVVFRPAGAEPEMVSALEGDQADVAASLSVKAMTDLIAKHQSIQTFSAREAPYGFVDWWPLSIYVNTLRRPFDVPDLRWAVSYSIDRSNLIQAVYQGAGASSQLPMPVYPALQPYLDSVKDLLTTHNTVAYDPARVATLFTRNNYRYSDDKMWLNAQGNPVQLRIAGWSSISDLGKTLADQLNKVGFDASFDPSPDAGDRAIGGDYDFLINGHGGSTNDPYDALALYQSSSAAVPGGQTRTPFLWRDADYDKIVDQMAQTPMEQEDRLVQLFRQAMEIWLPALPDIQLIQWHQRVPMNTRYWKGWPSKSDPYETGAPWQLGFSRVVERLEPV